MCVKKLTKTEWLVVLQQEFQRNTTLYLSLSTILLNSRDRQGMYGMQHFRMPRNPPYNRL